MTSQIFEQRAGAGPGGADLYLIDGQPVPAEAYEDRLRGMMARTEVVAEQAREAFEAEAAHMNNVAAWLTAESAWTAEHPDPDAPVPIRPSELRAMIAAEVTAALVAAMKGTGAADNGDEEVTP